MPVWLLVMSLMAPHLMPQTDQIGWTEHRLIAHAMGGMNGLTLTNAYDAFIFNYDKGFRVFEVDLQFTSDGYLVARHDWKPYLYGWLGQEKPLAGEGKPITWKEFKGKKIANRYRPLDLDDLVDLLKKYPDAYMVTDTKSTSPAEIRRQFRMIADKAGEAGPQVLNRVVPQIYHQEMYRILEEIYPFPSYIYTLYATRDSDREISHFVQRTPKIKAVTMPPERVSLTFTAELKKAGVITYVHTINDFSLYEKYRKAGIDGVYTDFLDASVLKRGLPQK